MSKISEISLEEISRQLHPPAEDNQPIDWIDLTVLNSAYEQMFSPSTNRWIHRKKLSEKNTWDYCRPYIVYADWNEGKAPDVAQSI